MEASALSEAAFAEFGKKVVLFCHITTRIKGEKYGDLLSQKGGQGFPHLVFMDSEGAVLTEPSGRAVADFNATLTKLDVWAAAKKKAAGGDKAAKIDLVLIELELGKTKVAEAKEALKPLGALSKAQQARLDDAALAADVKETLEGVNDADGAKAAGKKFAEMRKAGKTPKGEAAIGFHAVILEYAESEKDVALFEACTKQLHEILKDKPDAKKWLERQDKRLEKLKKGGE